MTTRKMCRIEVGRRKVPAALRGHLLAVEGIDGTLATPLTARQLEDARRGKVLEVVDVQVDGALARLHHTWAAMVSEPLPADVQDEVLLSLLARPELHLEYMGRGEIPQAVHLPDEPSALEVFDIPGGRRTYLFRHLGASGMDARMAQLAGRFGDWAQWLNDDGARVVVSLSGGGFRMFATTPALKVVDALLGNDRSGIDEVWGCSGGAFVGYLYAAGYRLSLIDQFGYDLYNGRLPRLVSGSVRSLARSFGRGGWAAMRGRTIPPEMVDWLAELNERQPAHARQPTLPFFALGTSVDRGGPFALTAPENHDALHGDFMLPCDPWRAVAASTAVPFLVRPVRDIGSEPTEQWVDGSISDETPLHLPFMKWQRERARSPETTPERLKILLVHLNLRTSEIGALTSLARFPPTRETILRAARLVDTALDTKTDAMVNILSSTPGVEILTAKLSLGWLGLHSPAQIPQAIRTGRTLESWTFEQHSASQGR